MIFNDIHRTFQYFSVDIQGALFFIVFQCFSEFRVFSWFFMIIQDISRSLGLWMIMIDYVPSEHLYFSHVLDEVVRVWAIDCWGTLYIQRRVPFVGVDEQFGLLCFQSVLVGCQHSAVVHSIIDMRDWDWFYTVFLFCFFGLSFWVFGCDGFGCDGFLVVLRFKQCHYRSCVIMFGLFLILLELWLRTKPASPNLVWRMQFVMSAGNSAGCMLLSEMFFVLQRSSMLRSCCTFACTTVKSMYAWRKMRSEHRYLGLKFIKIHDRLFASTPSSSLIVVPFGLLRS